MTRWPVLPIAVAAALAGLAAPRVAGAPLPCSLTLEYGSRSADPPGQFHLDLVIVAGREPTGATCRVSGYPEVELIGPADPAFGSIYVVPDQAGRSERVTLRPGRRAHAVLTWLPASSRGDRWTPGYVRVVVPTDRGASVAMALPWRYGTVLRQDAATHPGTYVGPIRGGAR